MIKFYYIDPIKLEKGSLMGEFNKEDAAHIYCSSLKVHRGKVFTPILTKKDQEKYKVGIGLYLTAEDENGLPWTTI